MAFFGGGPLLSFLWFSSMFPRQRLHGRFSWRHADGGPRRWGSRNHDFPKFCSGPKSGPKAPFGVKIGASDAENHEESENKFKIFPKFSKFPKKCPNNFKIYGKITFSRPPSAWTPIGAFLIGCPRAFHARPSSQSSQKSEAQSAPIHGTALTLAARFI